MATVSEIPLKPSTAQQFDIDLAGTTYRLRLRFNQFDLVWVLDISTPADVPVLMGCPVVTGVDLLAQHKHLGIPGQLWVQTDLDTQAVPTFDNLGTAGRLYFVVD